MSVSNQAHHEWYAIRVKSRCEKMVSEQLQQKGYEQFLPMYWSRRLWSDRVKVLQLPDSASSPTGQLIAFHITLWVAERVSGSSTTRRKRILPRSSS